MAKTSRITIQVTSALKEALTDAARRNGCTVQGFVLHAALRTATEVLEVEERPTPYYLMGTGWFKVSNDGQLWEGPTEEELRASQNAELVGTSVDAVKDDLPKLLENLEI